MRSFWYLSRGRCWGGERAFKVSSLDYSTLAYSFNGHTVKLISAFSLKSSIQIIKTKVQIACLN
jgi:hypothetical protein